MMTAMGILVLLAVAGSWVACFFRPATALILVIVLYPLKQLLGSYLPIFVVNSAWFNYLVFAGVCIAVLSAMSRTPGLWRGYWNRTTVLLLVMYVYALFAMIYSPSRDWAIERAQGGAPYWLMQMLMLPLVITGVQDLRRVLLPLVVFACIIMVLFYFNPNTTYRSGRLVMNLGYFAGKLDHSGNPLATAQMGGQIAIVAALMLPRRAGWLMLGVRLGALFMGLGIAVASGSRAQFLFAIIAIVLCWPLARTVRDVKQFFTNVVGLGFMALVVAFSIRFFISQNVEQDARWNPQRGIEDVSERVGDAFRLIEAWGASPLHWPFGLGTNAYSFISGEPHSYAHNFYIEMLGELGLLGLTLAIVLTLWIAQDARKLWNLHRDVPEERAAVGVLIALVVYGFLLALKQGTFVGTPEPWFLVAIVGRLLVRSTADAWAAGAHDDPRLASYADALHPLDHHAGTTQRSA